MATIPDEVVLEILSWLPCKSILRCKSVCKTWLNLITNDSNFTTLQLHRSNSTTNSDNTTLIFLTQDFKSLFFSVELNNHLCNTPSELIFPFGKSMKLHFIIGSCNGLLCLRDTLSFSLSSSNLYIWNPTIKNTVILPCPPMASPVYTSFPIFGFGYHPITKEYKVVRILGKPYDHRVIIPSQVCVYTLGKDTWNVLQDVCYHISARSFRSLVNGAFHWNASHLGKSCYDLILSFDIADQVFDEIPAPQTCDVFVAEDMTVSELDGDLCLSCFFVVEKPEIQIWVMKEYNVVDSWVKLYVIEQPLNWRDPAVEPLCVLDDGKVCFIRGKLQIVMYDPRTDLVHELEHFRGQFEQVYPLRRSLISPRGNNGVR